MADRQTFPPVDVPQIPKRNPSRPTLTTGTLCKRQPDLPSLQHDHRSEELDSKDNDRKRRQKTYFAESNVREDGETEEETMVGDARRQSREDAQSASVGGGSSFSPFLNFDPSHVGGLYRPGQKSDLAVDLSIKPVASEPKDSEWDQQKLLWSMIPKPLSLRPKPSVQSTQKKPGKTLSKFGLEEVMSPHPRPWPRVLEWSIETTQMKPGNIIANSRPKELSNTQPKALPRVTLTATEPPNQQLKTPLEPVWATRPVPKAFIQYSASEYSQDDGRGFEGADKTKIGRMNYDPRKYNHNVDWYLKPANFGKQLPNEKFPSISNGQLPKEATLQYEPNMDSLNDITGYKVTFENGGMSEERRRNLRDSMLWFEVETPWGNFTKGTKVQIQYISRTSQINKSCADWSIDIQVDFIHEKSPIAFIKGTYINRTSIKSRFQEAIGMAGETISDIPADIFDRYGRLKTEYTQHEMRKGTGVWGDEMDHGGIIIIDIVYIDQGWEQADFAKMILHHLIEQASPYNMTPSFVLIDPALSTPVLQDPGTEISHPARENAYGDGYSHSLVHVLRSLGFRRVGISPYFALATEQSHASYCLSEANDRELDARVGYSHQDFICLKDRTAERYFGPGLKGDARLEKLLRSHFLHWATHRLPEDECVNVYQLIKNKFEFNRFDPLYRNVLHVAATEQKPKCVIWLLHNVQHIVDLQIPMSLEGYTPLEALQAKLERFRTHDPFFTGFPTNAILCLSAFRDNLQPLDAIDYERLRFGCTCGGCVEGFMSPRTQFALLCKVTKIYQSLTYTSTEGEWDVENYDLLKYVQPDVQKKLALPRHNSRKGFINIFFHMTKVLESQLVPNIESIKKQAWKLRRSVYRVTKYIFEKGTAEAALRIVFEMARECDEWAGNAYYYSIHQVEFRVDNDALPKCRNDHEWELVTRMCGFMELPSLE